MHKFIIILITAILFSVTLSAQSNAFMRVDVITDKVLPKGKSVFIRGDHFFLGQWKEGGIRLTRKDSVTWSGIFIMKTGDKVSFLLDAGSKETGLLPYDTTKVHLLSDTLIKLKKSVPDLEIRKQGRLHKMPNTMEGRLVQRMVTVRTPPGYYDDTVKTYPTLYMHDGQFILGERSGDPKHWRLMEVIDSLEDADAIHPFILVAIDHNWDSRSMEYGNSDLGERYRQYLVEDLVPKVDLQFRTQETPAGRYIAGGVAGGYVSTYTAIERPDIFGNVIALSPTYVIMDNDLYNSVKADSLSIDPGLQFYIDKGEFGMDEDLSPGIDSTVDSLRQYNSNINFQYAPNTVPNGECFRYRVIPAIVHFFGKNQ
jgi:enterochelin esterase-like enzyme